METLRIMDKLRSLLPSAIAAMAIASAIAPGQTAGDQDLAGLLANETTRQSAVAQIGDSGQSKVPLLLSWTRTPPSQVDRYELYIGLADAFSQLKTRDAIPFLIKNISLHRWSGDVNIWLKTPKVIEERLPAVQALIAIGPDASKMLIRTFWEPPLVGEDRAAAIFAISVIASGTNDPEVRAFLSSVLGEASLERRLAEEGLGALDRRP
jgi:hypothetical protein